ncbi:alpha/beta hydrolase [Paucibacter sp. DJ1R-11]|uniref:alpha/beta fold hydrolase n=1 Tax=Paucibacter sp. DJ1R-11 TaxID=2893556 RepID=UPI0021E36464|nr:alpha/beta hydrolase [Paucibacter sp. DJ1R-11]MCV2363627.1 alpha/beta hydrolase [Paucibacter sp. DJ1R-11]
MGSITFYRSGFLIATLLACGAANAAPAAGDLSYEPFALPVRGQAPVAAELGTLTVPVRHAQPAGATLSLRFVRLKAVQPVAGLAPVVYLAGGPGGSGIGSALGARWPLFDRVRQQQDLILLDQRGTGRSSAAPNCPHALELPSQQPQDYARQLAADQAQARLCLAFWRQQGWDPNAFNTEKNAADLALLRRALGVPRLSLWGMSYGTHLAFAALRTQGQTLERVILMGSEGPNDTLKLPLDADRLISQIAAQRQRPDLPTLMASVIAGLAVKPMQLSVPGQPGLEGGIWVSAFDLQLATVMLLARRDSALQLPEFYDGLAAGKWDALATLVRDIRRYGGEQRLMPLAMDVASGASPLRLRQIAAEEGRSLLGPALNFPFPQIGEGLGIEDMGEAFRAFPASAVPTLFVSGEQDGRTPLHNAERLQRGFRHSRHLVIEGAGHDDDLWLASPVLAERMADFLAGREVSTAWLPRGPGK